MPPEPPESDAPHVLLAVLPLREICLFPESSLGLVVARPASIRALDVAERSGGRILALAQKDPGVHTAGPNDLHTIGTVAELSLNKPLSDGNHQVELDGVSRARVVTFLGSDTLVAEAEPLSERDAGNGWGPAVEALARYLHAHAELRSFLDLQRRSAEPMSWVNLACQHLPITATARQKLLEANAGERCLKVTRGVEALLRKEQGT